MKETCWN